ncbi:MAG: acetyl-CoA carboxylase biotin carboxyl carrier protein [Bdellovibrionales bacterium]|nr:acetyl-CoA carboxylase biotin carboxyl carrier protein [Bdellovibrionales bacterium]
MEIDDIEKLITLLKSSDVSEAEIEHDGTRIKLKRKLHTVNIERALAQPVAVESASSFRNSQVEIQSEEVDESLVLVESPIVGTFYRKPSPDADSFVSVDNMVKEGDTLCIVEAMKLMNEIPSPVSGRVEKVLITDGHVVEFGESLFAIRPS